MRSAVGLWEGVVWKGDEGGGLGQRRTGVLVEWQGGATMIDELVET